MPQRLLPPGGRIAIVAPSGAIDPEILKSGVAELTRAGFDVRLEPHVLNHKEGVFAASDSLRAADLASALADPDVDVVWCARGGYGALRTLDALAEFGGWRQVFRDADKVVVGFSDITVLHAASALNSKVGLHGPMLKHIALHGVDSPDVQATLALLRGEPFSIARPALPGSRYGEAHGKLVGGNLSILYSLAAARMLPDLDGAILFIEDLSEYRYHVDRMMRSLRMSGSLDKISGLVIGQMTGMKDGATPFGRDACQIVADAVADLDIPVFVGYPAGHAPDENYPLVMGADCQLSVCGGMATLSQGLPQSGF